MSKQCECPKCHTDEFVVSWNVVLFTLRDWPYMVFFTIFVIFIGASLDMSERDTLLFVLLSLFPLMFRFLHKFGCVKCQIEFYEGAGRELSSLSPSSASED